MVPWSEMGGLPCGMTEGRETLGVSVQGGRVIADPAIYGQGVVD